MWGGGGSELLTKIDMKKNFTIIFIATAIFVFTGCGSLDQTWSKDGVSFKYPDYMTISVDDFDPSSQTDIHIQTASITDFVEGCVKSDLSRNEDLIEYLVWDDYREVFRTLKDKGVDKYVKSFDNLSCGWTMGNVYSKELKIDGYNAVLHHKALAQDYGSLTVFYTQVIFVDDYDQVHSIVFSYDFGELEKYLDTFRGDFGVATIEGDYEYVAEEWQKILDFFVYGTPIEKEELKGFEDNKEIIEGIIETIKVDF